MRRKWSPEVKAMRALYKTLAPFDFDARRRMMQWLASRLASDEKGPEPLSPEESLWLAILRRDAEVAALSTDERRLFLRRKGFPTRLVEAACKDVV